MAQQANELTPEQRDHMQRRNTFFDITPATAEIAAERLAQALSNKRYTYITDMDGGSEMQVRTGVTLVPGDRGVSIRRAVSGDPLDIDIDHTGYLSWIALTDPTPPTFVIETARPSGDTVIHITQYHCGRNRDRRVRMVFIVPESDTP